MLTWRYATCDKPRPQASEIFLRDFAAKEIAVTLTTRELIFLGMG